MSKHTPTTEQVRSVFGRDGIGALSPANINRFNRWYDAEIRKAKESAWEVGVHTALRSQGSVETRHALILDYNPFKEASDE